MYYKLAVLTAMFQALLRAGLQELLLSLVCQEHMATSIKLLILRTLDSTLDCGPGMAAFLASHSYSRLVQLASSGLQSRTKFSLTSLLTKCHLSELLGQVAAAAARMGGSSNGHSEQEVVLGLEEVALGLQQARGLYRDLECSLAQPPRHLPSLSHTDLSASLQLGEPATGYFCQVSHHSLVKPLFCA